MIHPSNSAFCHLPRLSRTTYLFTTLLTTTGLSVFSPSPCHSPNICSSFTSFARCPSRSRPLSSKNNNNKGNAQLHPTTMSANNQYGGGGGVTVDAINGDKASALVIFMHGLGDSGHGWSSAFPFPNVPHVKYILPHAPNTPVSLNGGMRMPSWFDLYGLDDTAADDKAGIDASVQRIERIIEASNIPSERIVLAGFSQGGALALTTGLRSKKKFAGIVALSTWLPMRQSYPEKLGPHARNTRVFFGHGSEDTLVQTSFGEASKEFLKALGLKTEWKTFPMGHTACPEELAKMAEFVGQLLPPQ